MKRIEQRNKKLNEEAGKFEVWHSVSYHNHFDGYAEYYEEGKKHAKIRHVYVGEYYKQNLNRLQSLVLKFLYICLFAGGCWMCAVGGCTPIESNSVWYVNIPQAVALPCIFLGFIALVSYVCMPAKMKRRYYHFAVRGLQKGAFFSGCCCILSGAATIIFAFVHSCGFDTGYLHSAVLFLLAGILMFMICLIEHNITYEMLENTIVPPTGSVIL